MSLWIYSAVWLWYLGQKSKRRYFFVQPWYPGKSAPSFADALICLRRVLWRDLYNWVRVHGSLDGQTPAMCLGLAQSVWTALKYIRYPVHVSDLLRHHWVQRRQEAPESPLDVYQRKKSLPIS